jgi:hypothetical protein
MPTHIEAVVAAPKGRARADSACQLALGPEIGCGVSTPSRSGRGRAPTEAEAQTLWVVKSQSPSRRGERALGWFFPLAILEKLVVSPR